MGVEEKLIYPTHTAFDDVVEIIGKIAAAHPETVGTDEFLIVHGIICPYGRDISHAWIEDTQRDRVIFMGILDEKRTILSAAKQEFYDDSKVKEVTRYTPLQACAEEMTKGIGPWEDRYRALCNDRKKEEVQNG